MKSTFCKVCFLLSIALFLPPSNNKKLHAKYTALVKAKKLIKRNNNFVDPYHFYPQTDSSESFKDPDFKTDSFKEVKVMDLNNIDYQYLEEKFEFKILESARKFKGRHTNKTITKKNNAKKLPPDSIPENIMNIPVEDFHPHKWIIPYHKFYNLELEQKIKELTRQ